MMRKKIKRLICTIVFISFAVYTGSRHSFSQTADEMNRKAHEFYVQKKYSQAISLWLDVLSMEPDNVQVMQKIEEVYEVRQKRDMAYQKSKLNYRVSKKKLKGDDVEGGIPVGWDAISNYKTAFRLDPNDFEVRDWRERMRNLEAELLAAEEALRLSLALRAKIQELRVTADKESDRQNYEGALLSWKEILEYLPKDTEAKEGKRTCDLAIDNRLKFEKIRGFLSSGKGLFDKQEFKLARSEYSQVLNLDKRNREAIDYIDKIDELIEDNQLREIRKQQAETLYQSGIANLNSSNYDMAREDFEGVLSNVKDYKDTKEKLKGIDKLRGEHEIRERDKRVKLIDVLFQEGLLSYEEDKLDIAIAKFDMTLSLDAKNQYAREWMDKAQRALKQKQEETVDENSPYYELVNSLILSGKDLFDRGMYVESAKRWERIIKLFPKNKMAKEYTYKCFYKANPGKLDAFSKNLFESGRKLFAEKKLKEAKDKFLLLKSLNEAYPGLDEYLVQAKNVKETYVESQLVQVDRQEIERKYQYAIALYQKGGKENIEGALGVFKWIVQKDPNNVKAVINVNKIEAQLRITTGIVAAAAQLNPEMRRKSQKHYYNGISYYSNNNYRKAIEEWQKVLIIDPGNMKAKNNIQKCRAFLGKYGGE